MVKKRNRDPEILAEAPPTKADGDDSGSDEVQFTPRPQIGLSAHAIVGY
jgi:hypothetical protein